MKMKMQLCRIPRVPYLSNDIACLYLRAGFHGQRERLQVRVISELIVSMIDNHNIAAGRLNVRCFAGSVLSHVPSHGNDGAVLCCENLLGVGVVVGTISAIALVARSEEHTSEVPSI